MNPIRQYWKNIAGIILTIFVCTLTFVTVWWQQDILLAGKIDWTRTPSQFQPREVLPGWKMFDADFYVLLFMTEFIAYVSVIIGLVLSLWFWD